MSSSKYHSSFFIFHSSVCDVFKFIFETLIFPQIKKQLSTNSLVWAVVFWALNWKSGIEHLNLNFIHKFFIVESSFPDSSQFFPLEGE